MTVLIKDDQGKIRKILASPNDTYLWATRILGGNWMTSDLPTKRLEIHLDKNEQLERIFINGVEQDKGLSRQLAKHIMMFIKEELRK